jgi:hypothetical protein
MVFPMGSRGLGLGGSGTSVVPHGQWLRHAPAALKITEELMDLVGGFDKNPSEK